MSQQSDMQLAVASSVVGGLTLGYFIYHNIKIGITDEERNSIFKAAAVGLVILGAIKLYDAEKYWDIVTKQLDEVASQSPYATK